MTAYFDVFPQSGAKIGIQVAVRVSDEFGRDDLLAKLKKLETENGPLLVQHLGLGYLSSFSGGELRHEVTI